MDTKQETNNERRERRMATAPDKYPVMEVRYTSSWTNGPATYTDRFCIECKNRIDVPHDLGCEVGSAEAIALKSGAPVVDGETDPREQAFRDAVEWVWSTGGLPSDELVAVECARRYGCPGNPVSPSPAA